MTEPACPFCTPDAERVFYRVERVFALWDAFPVSDGHALIVTKRHVATWFDASRDEQADLLTALRRRPRGRLVQTPSRRLQHRGQHWRSRGTDGAAPSRSFDPSL